VNICGEQGRSCSPRHLKEDSEMSENKLDSQINAWERIHKYRFLILAMATFFIGLLLLIFAERLGEVWRDLGISMIVAATVGLGVEFYTRREAEKVVTEHMKEVVKEEIVRKALKPGFDMLADLLQDSSLRSHGVRQIYMNRLQNDFFHYVEAAEPGSDIRLLGISMSRLAVFEAQGVMSAKLREGCQIKLLLLNPRSEHIVKRAAEEGWDATEFHHDVESWGVRHRAFVQRLRPELRQNMELRLYDAAPDYFVVDNGKSMLVGFYLRTCSGEEVPHLELEVRDDGAYLPFRRHFDSLWASAEHDSVVFVERRRQRKSVPMERRREAEQVA
jgi:hypothetical protein